MSLLYASHYARQIQSWLFLSCFDIYMVEGIRLVNLDVEERASLCFLNVKARVCLILAVIQSMRFALVFRPSKT